MKEILAESIKTHYDNKDYTEVVRDALLCLTTEIRKKSDLKDNDGVDLINKAFSEKQPLIKINKLETETDKNKHRGIMDLSKGLIEYFRNPMSHSKQEYSKKIADAILVLLDEVILEEIVGSKSVNSIDDWYLEFTNDLSPNTERYAKKLIATIPNNKYYELSVMLYKNRDNTPKLKDKIIDELVSNLSSEEFRAYGNVMEKDLFGNVLEKEIISILNFISSDVWKNLSNLAKTKIEDMIQEDISKFHIDYEYDGIEYLPSRQNGYIIEKITLDSNTLLQDFLLEKYFSFIINENTMANEDLLEIICNSLNSQYNPTWYNTAKEIIKQLPKDNYWYTSLAESFGLELLEKDPFEDFDTLEISEEDLPF